MTDHEHRTLGLGELEAAIMEVVWAGAPTTVREVLSELMRSPRPGYTTVATVMNRLVNKGILQRTRSGKADIYQAPMTREQYMGQVAAATVNRLVNDCGDLALAQFAAAL
ncbi:MAG TPA: BlaI/MecI/CopY family transcriptional regulator, partial [Chloroflexota bacterium]|nr:BlaI/MecI/CopY family transcriptional regulator [Chloroflexota bacterium]